VNREELNYLKDTILRHNRRVENLRKIIEMRDKQIAMLRDDARRLSRENRFIDLDLAELKASRDKGLSVLEFSKIVGEILSRPDPKTRLETEMEEVEF
jgi:chromosome segregation ATPase